MTASAQPPTSQPATSIPDDVHGALIDLDHLAVLDASGVDAASFLHNQLSNDVLHLDASHAQLAGYCSAKGRMLGSFLNWRDGETIHLAMPREQIDALCKRLTMFVMRAKVKLDSAPLRAWGLVGAAARPLIASHFGSVPEQLWERVTGPAGTLIRMPDADGLARWILFGADGADRPDWAAALPATASAVWRWLDVRAALPWIMPATQDKFVPQMINFEALGGVNFKKGCYPGQEVVARSQYLGKLKRRMRLAHASAGPAPEPGSDIVGADGAPLARVVNAETSPHGGVDVLIELPLAEDGSLHLSAGAAPLELLAPPYPLPDNEAFIRPKL